MFQNIRDAVKAIWALFEKKPAERDEALFAEWEKQVRTGATNMDWPTFEISPQMAKCAEPFTFAEAEDVRPLSSALSRRGIDTLCSFCGALPGKPCVSDRGRTRESPHKVRWADAPATKALREQLVARDKEWWDWVRPLVEAGNNLQLGHGESCEALLGYVPGEPSGPPICTCGLTALEEALRPFKQKPVGFQDCAL